MEVDGCERSESERQPGGRRPIARGRRQGCIITCLFYEEIRGLDPGVRACARRPRTVHRRLPRLVVSVAAGNQRPAAGAGWSRSTRRGWCCTRRARRSARSPAAWCLYYIGRKGGDAFVRRRFSAGTRRPRDGTFQRYGVMAMLIPSLLPPPAPFKIFVLLAGVAGISATRFVTAIAIGRGIRYFGEGLLAVWYGDQAIAFIHENAASRLGDPRGARSSRASSATSSGEKPGRRKGP